MLQNVESLYVQLTLHAEHVTTLTTECLRQSMQNYSRFVFCTYMRVCRYNFLSQQKHDI